MTVSALHSFAAGLALSVVAFVAVVGGELPAGDTPPDAAPGLVASTDPDEICDLSGGLTYSKQHRATTIEMKIHVFMRDLGRVPHGKERPQWEIDHRVPLCLGGADDERNLWAQRNFHEKDTEEAFACREVCHGNLSITKAQECFLGDLSKLHGCLR